MNEQLVVKNFGPIKDATVDFKRVTVFIGPTGGGKSTLAKLAAIFRNEELMHPDPVHTERRRVKFLKYNLDSYFSEETYFDWITEKTNVKYTKDKFSLNIKQEFDEQLSQQISAVSTFLGTAVEEENALNRLIEAGELLKSYEEKFRQIVTPTIPIYIPSERIFVAAINTAWPGLMSENIGLPKTLTEFANRYFQARESISFLRIPFFEIDFFRTNGQDLIVLKDLLPLKISETASGIQSVTPLLVLLEHLSRNTEQAQSFIIEEPELNLYPTAQQGLLNWLVEKCTKGENDLTITTHSPYILSHLNLLLYAYQVGNKSEEKRAKVKAIIPEEYWINPDEFAAYYVNGPEGENGIHSLVDAETKLISQNGLDTVSGIQADQFDQLLDINSGF